MSTLLNYLIYGHHPITALEPKGRLTFPIELKRGLENRVHAFLVGHSNVRINEHGITYRERPLVVVDDSEVSELLRKKCEEIRKKRPNAPAYVVKEILLKEQRLYNCAEGARNIVIREQRVAVDAESFVYGLIRTTLEEQILEIPGLAEQGVKQIITPHELTMYSYLMDDGHRFILADSSLLKDRAKKEDAQEYLVIGTGKEIIITTQKGFNYLQTGALHRMRTKPYLQVVK